MYVTTPLQLARYFTKDKQKTMCHTNCKRQHFKTGMKRVYVPFIIIYMYSWLT